SDVGVELRVDRAGGVESCDVVARFAANRGKCPADDDLVAAGIVGHGVNAAVKIGIVGGVDGAVGIEPGDVVVRGAAHARERAADDNFSVGLRNGGEGASGRIELEARIE